MALLHVPVQVMIDNYAVSALNLPQLLIRQLHERNTGFDVGYIGGSENTGSLKRLNDLVFFRGYEVNAPVFFAKLSGKN